MSGMPIESQEPITVADILTVLNKLTFTQNDDLKPDELPLPVSDSSSLQHPPIQTHSSDAIANCTVRPEDSGDMLKIEAEFAKKLENFRPVAVDASNLEPALNYYGAPPNPPPFKQPVRWLEWSRPEKPGEDVVEGSSENIPESESVEKFNEEMDSTEKLRNRAEKFEKFMLDKISNLESELKKETSNCEREKQLYEKLLNTMKQCRDKAMTAIGELLRDNEALDERIKEFVIQQSQLEREKDLKLQEMEKETQEGVENLEQVIKERDEMILQILAEIKALKDFAAERDNMERGIQELRRAAQIRYENQLLELDQIHNMQVEEQRRLQGMAADRLLALTEQNYDQVVENLDEETIGIFLKNCQVQDAVETFTTERDGLLKEKIMAKKKLKFIEQKKKKAAEYLKRYGEKTQTLREKVRQLEESFRAEHKSLNDALENYENNLQNVVPGIRKGLKEKITRVRELRGKLSVKEAEICRLNQLVEIVQRETSFMEKALLWSINRVLTDVKADSVDDLLWEQREMVLRRTFVLVNSAKKGQPDLSEAFLSTAMEYVGRLESSLKGDSKIKPDIRAIMPGEGQSTISTP